MTSPIINLNLLLAVFCMLLLQWERVNKAQGDPDSSCSGYHPMYPPLRPGPAGPACFIRLRRIVFNAASSSLFRVSVTRKSEESAHVEPPPWQMISTGTPKIARSAKCKPSGLWEANPCHGLDSNSSSLPGQPGCQIHVSYKFKLCAPHPNPGPNDDPNFFWFSRQ